MKRHEGVLLVRVTAPPVGGAANAALERLLVKALGVPRRAVRIVSGAKSRQKLVSIEGLGVAEVWEKLAVK